MIARKQKNRPAEKTKTRQAQPPTKAKAAPVVDGKKPLTIEIDIESIDAQPFNPRTAFDQAELESLAASLKDHGLLQPIIVRINADGRHELIAGGRRLKAAAIAGWKTVPATVRNATDEDAITWAMIENVDREDLNPVDLARGVARLCSPKENGGCGLTETDTAAAMGRGAQWVRRQVRLLKLPEIWLARIASGEISASMGEVLVKYEHRPDVLAKIEQDMIAHRWAWRTIDDFERNAAMIADEGEAAAAVKPLQPMRARPGEATDPASIRRRQYPKGSDASTSVGDDVDAGNDSDPATPPATSSAAHAGDEVEGLETDPPSKRVEVSQIVDLIELLDDIAELNEITLAVDRRRRALSSSTAAS